MSRYQPWSEPGHKSVIEVGGLAAKLGAKGLDVGK